MNLNNGLNLEDIKLISLQIFIVLVLVLISNFVLSRKGSGKNSFLEYLIVSWLSCFFVILSKNSVPLSILVLPVLFLLSSYLKKDKSETFVFILIGFGCGSGYVVLTSVFLLFLVLPTFLFFMSKKGNEEK